MYDMSSLKIRYFEVKLRDGKILNVEPPRLNVLREIAKLSKQVDGITEEGLTSLAVAVSLALSKNKENKKMSAKQVEDMLDLDDMYALLVKYFTWVGEIQNIKN